mgnify:CR=1 FL=1
MRLLRCIGLAAALIHVGLGEGRWSWAAPAASASGGSQAAVAAGAAEVPAKVRRYAERLFHRYDLNRDGVLEPTEWSKMQGQPESADADRNGKITLDEWTNHILGFGRGRRLSASTGDGGAESAARPAPANKQGETANALLQPPTRLPPRTTFHVPKSRLPAGLPDWFLRRDLNGDGQVSLGEYAPNAAPADVEQFARYDRNGDGLITVQECLGGRAPSGRKASGAAAKGEKKSDAK